MSIRIHKFMLLLFSAIMLLTYSCKKENNNSGPVITGVRAISPAPNDSVLTKAGPGQSIVIQGANLKGTKAIYFNGYPSAFNSALFSDNTIAVTIPADMPFASLSQDKLNTIRIVSDAGEVVFQFPIVPPPPVITSMSNENAKAGTKVTISGNNFFFIDKVVFPGNVEATTNIKTNDAGTSLEVTVPAGVTSSGPIQVVNQYGTGVSLLLFNDFTTGVLHNYDNISKFEWGAGSSGSSADYPGNSGTYGLMKAENVGGGDFGWWNGSRSINTVKVNWMPTTSLNEPVDNYALKFDINVKSPWSGGSIYILKDYDWTYVARYEPWDSPAGAINFTTDGWQTVVLPLSMFKKKANGIDGSGESVSSLTTLLGASANGSIHFFFVNRGTTAVASFEAAIDNIRVIKIK